MALQLIGFIPALSDIRLFAVSVCFERYIIFPLCTHRLTRLIFLEIFLRLNYSKRRVISSITCLHRCHNAIQSFLLVTLR